MAKPSARHQSEGNGGAARRDGSSSDLASAGREERWEFGRRAKSSTLEGACILTDRARIVCLVLGHALLHIIILSAATARGACLLRSRHTPCAVGTHWDGGRNFGGAAIVPFKSAATKRASLAELPGNPQHLVPFRHAFGAAERTDLQLPGVCRHGQMGDQRVLGFSGARRNNRSPAGLLCDPDRRQRFAHGADLVELDKHSVCQSGGDPLADAVRIGCKQVVAHELHPLAQRRVQLRQPSTSVSASGSSNETIG